VINRVPAKQTPWPVARSSSSLSAAPKAKPSLPTRSRRRHELIMLTYGGLNERVKAGDVEAARAIFNGGGGIVWWHYGSRNSSSGGGDGRAPPPSSGLIRKDLVRWTGSRTLGDQWRARFGVPGPPGKTLYRGELLS
jgi:hypothetical protein